MDNVKYYKSMESLYLLMKSKDRVGPLSLLKHFFLSQKHLFQGKAMQK